MANAAGAMAAQLRGSARATIRGAAFALVTETSQFKILKTKR